ncbi:HAD family hydrolase [Dinghuibacter silviterrae]|uniref:HAD superfamily hydrolase (TIGR01490 family) n=1 Tax=Dinghuibacter silviterrae TaxID=1539049 RepID=A0A4R8DUR5_9BACT|nr:HAD family hydrolase [Dinghuibacter silviterrae]TDX01919.1 HAD superfamily hydrolase (TIGR01490 family) [Dinghuibacter silviterrae]
MTNHDMVTAYSHSAIAFFDFDGTITTKDTLAELLKFKVGRVKYYIGLVFLSPVLVLYKLGLLSNHNAKEIMLGYFLKGEPAAEFNALCREFAETRLPALFRKGALSEIRRHLQNNTQVVIVTASPENWVQPWCQQFNLECIATKLKVRNGRMTGKIAGQNCAGEEKVKLILKRYNLSYYTKIYAYGDTPGDLPMLSLATDSYYKPFKERAY